MRHQRRHSRQTHTPPSPDETSVGFFTLDAGPGCQQGPMEGFLFLTPGDWSLCSKDESTVLTAGSMLEALCSLCSEAVLLPWLDMSALQTCA